LTDNNLGNFGSGGGEGLGRGLEIFVHGIRLGERARVVVL
jgi:hypothetical protein